MNEKRLELFEKYLEGTLPEQEADDFQRQLQDDPELASDFEAFRISATLIKADGFRSEVSEVVAEKDPVVIPLYKRGIFRYAAAAVISLLGVWVYFLSKPTVAPEELFISYYEPYADIYLSRGTVNSFSEAMSAYSNREYERAIVMFDSLADKTDGVYFYQALCYLSLRKPDKALDNFNQLTDGAIFTEQARWYEALALLLLNKQDPAIESLKEIKPGQFNYNEARAIIDKLD